MHKSDASASKFQVVVTAGHTPSSPSQGTVLLMIFGDSLFSPYIMQQVQYIALPHKEY